MADPVEPLTPRSPGPRADSPGAQESASETSAPPRGTLRGLALPRLGFGCGSNAGLMVSDDEKRRREVVEAAVDAGFNLFDTAPAYGNGVSERHLGEALADADGDVQLFTKVSLAPADLSGIKTAVLKSVRSSLERLGRSRVTAVTLHNRIGQRRDVDRRVGPGPVLSIADVLGDGGVVAAFDDLRDAGMADAFGITTLGGDKVAIDQVMDSHRLDYVNAVYGVLGELDRTLPRPEGAGADYDPVATAAVHGMGVMALRVLGGGLLMHPGKQQQRAVRALRRWCDDRGTTLARVAIRYALTNPDISTSIIGFSDVAHVRDAANAVREGPLSQPDVAALVALRQGGDTGAAST